MIKRQRNRMSKIISGVSTGAIYRRWCVSAATSEVRGRKREPRTVKGGLREREQGNRKYTERWMKPPHWRRQDVPGDVEIIQLVPGLFLNASLGAAETRRRQVRRGPRYTADISKYHQSLREFTIPVGPTCYVDVDASWRKARGDWRNFGKNNSSRDVDTPVEMKAWYYAEVSGQFIIYSQSASRLCE